MDLTDFATPERVLQRRTAFDAHAPIAAVVTQVIRASNSPDERMHPLQCRGTGSNLVGQGRDG
ncbi:hypothetical protein [Mesorhizobium sp. NZP2234]|uniref:hypothetical protein n=1 Tax=Mesorhizobium sp. NZP2234 TaxID=2483402 RepID=UPI001552F9A7|nr:hypothetical protein [Mesorhizobium sp. NZP2234]